MSASTGSVLIAVVVYYKGGHLRKIVGRMSMAVALLFVPIAVENATRMVNCETVQLTSAAIASLDGGATITASNTARVTVPVLLSSWRTLLCLLHWKVWA